MDTREFVEDFQRLDSVKMREKYELVFTSSISEVLHELGKMPGGLSNLLMDRPGNQPQPGPISIARCGDQYEVFEISERGGKWLSKVYRDLEDAAFDFFDRYLGNLLCVPPDSKINAGYPESEYLKKLREEKLSRLRAQKQA